MKAGLAIASLLLLLASFSDAQQQSISGSGTSTGAVQATDGLASATASPTGGTRTSFRSIFTVPSAADVGASMNFLFLFVFRFELSV